jgi:phosphatidate cytidylyltransferase
MGEDHVRDRNRSDQAAVTPAEGVRILGAEEAQAALDLSHVERADAETPEAAFGLRFPANGPSWSASDTGDAPEGDAEPEVVDAPEAVVPPLPHWTEPPTGAVPAIFADDDESVDDDLDAWAAVTGNQQPRFRAEGSDWAEADFSEEISGEHERLGALDEQGPRDEEAEFAQALAARRAPKRARRGARPEPQPAAAIEPDAAVPIADDPPVTAPSAEAAPPAPASRPRPQPQPARRPPEPELAPQGPSRSRDLPTAIMTAATMVIVAFVCFLQGPAWTTALAALVIGVAAVEFAHGLRTKGLRTATPIALVASATMPIAAYNYGTNAYPIYFALVTIFSMVWFLWRVTPGRPLVGVATTVLSFAYVGGLGGFAGLLLAAPDGVGLLLGVAITTIAYDVVGFFVGSQFGRSRIAPNVSPNKSLEGTIAGKLASVVLGAVVVGNIAPWSVGDGLLLGAVVAVGAFLGDLSESMIKRDLGVKDFGALLPGHGGVLDRFDGLLFCLPIAYYLAIALDVVNV